MEMNALQYTCALENYDWKEVQKWNQLAQLPVNIKNISVNQESNLYGALNPIIYSDWKYLQDS